MLLLIAALALLALPLYAATRWMAAAARGLAQAEAVQAVLTFLPESLQTQRSASALFIGCCVGAMILAWLALKTVKALVKTVVYGVLLVAGLLGAGYVVTAL